MALTASACAISFTAGTISVANTASAKVVPMMLKSQAVCGPPYTTTSYPNPPSMTYLKFPSLGNAHIVQIMADGSNCVGPAGGGDRGVNYVVWYQG